MTASYSNLTNIGTTAGQSYTNSSKCISLIKDGHTPGWYYSLPLFPPPPSSPGLPTVRFLIGCLPVQNQWTLGRLGNPRLGYSLRALNIHMSLMLSFEVDVVVVLYSRLPGTV